jgi:hypothetical protein
MSDTGLRADAEGVETDWAVLLRARLSADATFRELFERRPGEAAASIGIPYDVFREIWPDFARPDEAD